LSTTRPKKATVARSIERLFMRFFDWK